MAGTAKTNEFMLATATVMLGAPEDLHDLNPLEHSIGLVKNFTMSAEPGYTELTQGVKNSIVHSTLTSNPVRASMEAYEYTAKNFGYALGLQNADQLTPFATETTLAALVDGGSPTADDATLTSATGIVANDYVLFMKDNDDDFIVRQVTNVATNVITVNHPLPDMPAGTKVKKVHSLGVGSKDDQPFYAAKIAGKLVSGEPVVILIPKVRVSRGFNLAFVSDNYSNLPLELSIYDLVSTDDFYTEFNGEQARLFRA